jgi:folate-binding protein YgfZ
MPEVDALFWKAEHAGLFDRSDRCRLVVRGPARAKFLHNLVTNEVKRLPVGKGCEAFVTSTQGRTLAFVIVLAAEDAIWIGTDSGGVQGLLPHLEKYGVFDDIAIEDQSAATFEYHLAGSAIEDIVGRCGCELPESVDLAHLRTELCGAPVRLVRESPAGLPGLTLIGDIGDAGSIKQSLIAAGGEPGVVEAGPEMFEILRIEAGTPVFGKDITEKNLPQEIGRDARAISFVKGCYLGQETVARLDALGHVNQILRGLIFDAGLAVPEAGTPLEDAGKRVGVVTSPAFSPRWNGAVALAFLRTTHSAPGTRVQARDPASQALGTATVSQLPLERPGAE